MAVLELADLTALRSVVPPTYDASRRIVIDITNGKGGVGKSSLSSNFVANLASIGQRVLLIEMDPQGNTAEDLGFTGDTSINDRGKSQAEAVLGGLPFTPTGEVRPGLFVVPGGAHLEEIAEELYCQQRLARNTGDPTWMYMYAASIRAVAHEYDLIVLDVAPGSAVLQTQAMVSADWVIVPTRSDRSSRRGLASVARRMIDAKPYNEDLTFLGIVLFGSGTAASRVQGRIRQALEADVHHAATVFDKSIRYVEAAAEACRTHGKVAQEISQRTPSGADADGSHAGPSLDPHVRKSAGLLADDYRVLTIEILTRIGHLRHQDAG